MADTGSVPTELTTSTVCIEILNQKRILQGSGNKLCVLWLQTSLLVEALGSLSQPFHMSVCPSRNSIGSFVCKHPA